jgi:MFS family permease
VTTRTDPPAPPARTGVRVTVALGLAQTLAWAGSYYLPAMLAAPIAQELGLASATVFAAFSLALVVSAAVGPLVGRAIDRRGGRPVLMATSLAFALGLVALSRAQGLVLLFAAWGLLGVAMGAGLYEAAFASLVRLYGHAARDKITGITLFGGFASTLGWPLSTLMIQQWGWREACLGWAALHLLLGLPLNACVPQLAAAGPDAGSSAARPGGAPPPPAQTLAHTPPARPRLTAGLLSLVFAIAWFTSTAMAAHLPQLLQQGGATLAVAVAAGALVGPAQVAGRLLEFAVLRRWHPLLSARLASAAHPLGVALLLALGPAAALAFAVLHGAGNGILTIAKGHLPLALFGAEGYGARQGWMMMPGRVAQALAPVVFGMALTHWGLAALWLTAALGGVSLGALMLLRR